MSIYSELKRRNVFKVSAAYVIVGWLIMQVGEVMAPALHLPDWALSTLAFFIILGFPLAVLFAWAFELTPDGLKWEREIDRSQSITHVTGRKLNFAITALMGLALAFFAYDKFVLDPGRDAAQVQAALDSAREEDADATPADASEKSVAVLPFVNMSNDPDQEHFSDGIAEELLNVLARYPGLRVAARTSSFQFKGRNLDIADIARQLHVNHVLEGSVRKAGNRVRVTAQLIEADRGYHLWSETYDRELNDVFAIQDEISAAIGNALKVTLALDGGGVAAPTVTRAANPQAFEAFAAGRRLVHLRGKENLEQAVRHLRESLSLDPAYAPAHAQLAIAYVMLADAPGTYGDWPYREAAARAEPHVERALALNSGLAEAFGARALMALNEPDYEAAIHEAWAALEINPSYSDALNWLFIAYQNTGRYKEAYDALMDLVRIDPLSVPGRSNAAKYLARTGRMAEGIAMADSIAERNFAFAASTRGQIAYDVQGELTESLRWFLSGLKQDPSHRSNNSYAAFLFGMLDLLHEALRTPEYSHQWAWYAHNDWADAIGYLGAQVEATPSSVTWRYRLARTLFAAGRVEEACVLFEQLLSEAGGRALFSEFYTAMPTAWAAFGRQQSGDDAGAALLIEMVEQDQAALERSGERLWWYYKTAALVAVLKGQDERALEQLQRAVEAGGVERMLLEDPVFARLSARPEFKALQQRVAQRRAAERAKVLHMLCVERPADIAWQPLPETCAGLEQKP